VSLRDREARHTRANFLLEWIMSNAHARESRKLPDLKPRGTTVVSRLEAEDVWGGRKAGKDQQDYMKYVMKEVFIT
jgi:hypothetical protein